MAEPDGLRHELAVAMGSGPQPADHPDEGELLAYSCGDLDDQASERLAEHLTRCTKCLGIVLDLDGFLDPGASPAADIATARAWRELRSELPSASESVGARETPSEVPLRAAARRPWSVLAAAAGVLLALALGALLIHQQRVNDRLRDRIARLDAPQPDAPIVDLFPRGTVRAGDASGGSATVPFAADAGFVILVLNLAGDADHEKFVAELLDAAGEILWSGPLRRSDYGTFRLGVPRRWLGSGGREIRLYGQGEDGDRELLETFALEPTRPEEVSP